MKHSEQEFVRRTMKIYFAPMEGITGYLYRQAHHRCFGGVDKYYTPFLSPTKEGVFSKREKREVLPANNEGIPVVPQLLTCKAEDFIWAADQLFDLGYEEINLNLGCPSGTVTAKKKGAGFLAFPEELDRFLEAVYSRAKGRISIKTRLGMKTAEEFEPIQEIYNKYPIWELTIHPRVREDYYKGQVRLSDFQKAFEKSRHPICYNGDIATLTDYNAWREGFPQVDRVMIGRGLVADPALGEKLRGDSILDRERLHRFHDSLYESYCEAFGDRRTAMMRMKEYWFYHSMLFADSKKHTKKIKKATDPREFERITASVFRELELLPQAEVEWRAESVG